MNACQDCTFPRRRRLPACRREGGSSLAYFRKPAKPNKKKIQGLQSKTLREFRETLRILATILILLTHF